MDAARELYGEKGIEHTTILDITERLGVTRTLFYHYFPNKHDLTLAVLDSYVADYLEALELWNENRPQGDIDQALQNLVKLLRLCVFDKDSFYTSLVSNVNVELHTAFANRVAEHTTNYILETTVKDYASLHDIKIDHLYETFYMLIVGAIGYLRTHPETDDAIIADVIAQTLYLERPNKL